MANPADKRFHQLTLAIQKAINSIETPVKEKHVRSTIIGTFQDQSAITYWMVALRQPLQDNRIVAWKFCHVTHKLLREGHPACLDDSQRHIGMIENLGKLWVHLREGYGRLIHLYTNLLATKLKFHARNPRFPGNMQVTADELDSIAENDVNNYFQICVELFDYMDDILILQAAVFESLGNARANSMTASGQCRLAALIPCAQDASHVYDCGVRLLFRLHASLPPDTLSGHRERFRQQFKKLSSFYKHASSLQYYRNLLSLPVLPANPPNFLLQSDFGTYVTPVVSIPEQPPDEVDSIGSLIDTSDTASQMTSPDHMDILDTRTTPSPVPDPIIERDRLIDHLQNELKRMRSDVSQIVQERNTMLGSMREHCTRMESQLRATKNELEDEKQKLEILSVETPEIKKKLTETEEKAKVSDEKFQKLKGAYTQLREEHISLIRQKAEVDKATANLRAAAAQHESAKTMLQQQLNDRMKDVELLQQSASSSEEVDAYKTEISNLRSDLEQSRQKELELESLRASMEALEIEHKTALTEQQEKLSLVSGELKEATENVEKYKQEVGERDIELNKIKEELIGLRQKSGDEYKRVVEEKEMALTQLSELTQQYNQEKEMHTQITNDLQTELDTLQRRFTDVEQSLLTKCQKLEDQLCIISREYEDVLLKKDIEVKDTAEKLFGLQNELKQEIDSKDHEMSHLMSKFDEATKLAEEQKIEFDEYKSENSLEMTMLQNTIVLNEKYIQDIISELLAKEEHIKNIEMDRENLNLNVLEHTDKLEAMKNYIIANQGELINIKKHHEEELVQIEINKNKELVEMNETIRHLSEEKQQVAAEFQKQIYQHISEQEVLENTIMKLKETEITLLEQIQALNVERTEKETSLKIEIDRITSDMLKIIHEKDDVITELNTLLSTTKDEFKTQMTEKENTIVLSETTIEELKQQNDEMKRLNSQINEDFKMALSEKENEIQLTEARLSHTEIERLNAECELQDLLQQNTILEADMAALKIQLEEANLEIKKKTSKLVSCAGETALEVTNKALSAFDNSNAQDANKAAAELAAKAFEDLARKSQIEGNEELVAKSAIFAAHNAAQVSAYVAEVSNVSTDMELSEKMNNECRNMLNSVKHCLEAMSKGTIDRTVCMEARNGVQGVARTAAGADRLPGTSVDDELADMDRAIEQAASQIEEMLAASRKGDTGVKLEVNEKILDACTTLMGAVKILVQDARKLQNEIGDPKTRQKMYRKNPQWSEGLISAGKAVVFAAKLLVSSADEAAGASGRVEGVSAAAHEVAGSTAQLVAASRARAPPAAPSLARLTAASRAVASAAGAVVAAVRGASALVRDQDALDTSSLSLTATRRLEMESKVRALELESALDAERARLAALRKRHYHLAQLHENGNVANGDE